MNPRDNLPIDPLLPEREPAPLSYVPTPSAAYRQHRKAAQLLDEPGQPRGLAEGEPAPVPVPLPFAFGARVLMWKQDPSPMKRTEIFINLRQNLRQMHALTPSAEPYCAGSSNRSNSRCAHRVRR